MTFQELESYENMYCVVRFLDGRETVGHLQRMHDAAWRPYFSLNGTAIDPPEVESVATRLEERPRLTRDEPQLPGNLDLPDNAIPIPAPADAAPQVGTAVLVPGESVLGWIGVVIDLPASDQITVAATAVDGSRLSMDSLSVAASDVGILRDLGHDLVPGSRALRQKSGRPGSSVGTSCMRRRCREMQATDQAPRRCGRSAFSSLRTERFRACPATPIPTLFIFPRW